MVRCDMGGLLLLVVVYATATPVPMPAVDSCAAKQQTVQRMCEMDGGDSWGCKHMRQALAHSDCQPLDGVSPAVSTSTRERQLCDKLLSMHRREEKLEDQIDAVRDGHEHPSVMDIRIHSLLAPQGPAGATTRHSSRDHEVAHHVVEQLTSLTEELEDLDTDQEDHGASALADAGVMRAAGSRVCCSL